MAKKVNADTKEKCRIITPEFRVFYPHVFKPQGMKGAEPKYSITMAFKKTQDLSAVKLAMKHAKIAEFGPNKEEWPDLESPVVDGDQPKYADKPEYKGHWIIKATSIQVAKPGIVDRDMEPIIDPTLFYPGCFARAQVFARVWEFSGKQGIHFILDHVQKTKEGNAIGGKKDIKDVFGPIGGDDGQEDETDDSDSFM